MIEVYKLVPKVYDVSAEPIAVIWKNIRYELKGNFCMMMQMEVYIYSWARGELAKVTKMFTSHPVTNMSLYSVQEMYMSVSSV